MADILDAAQTNTQPTPPSPPPVEPPPAPPTPPVTSTDSLIVPPPEPPAPEPIIASTPTPPPKKKSKIGVLLAGLLLLAITLPIGLLALKSQADVRSRATAPVCANGLPCPSGWYCNGTAVPGTSGSFASKYCTQIPTTPAPPSTSPEGKGCITTGGWVGTCTVGNDVAKCNTLNQNFVWDNTVSTCKSTTAPGYGCCGKSNALAPTPTSTSTSCTIGAQQGNCLPNASNFTNLCTSFAINTSCPATTPWCCVPKSTSSPVVGASCSTTQGWPGTCTVGNDIAKCTTTNPGIAWDNTVSPCKSVSGYGCCGISPIVNASCTTAQGTGTCTQSDVFHCNTNNAGTTWDKTVSPCKNLSDYGCCVKSTTTTTSSTCDSTRNQYASLITSCMTAPTCNASTGVWTCPTSGGNGSSATCIFDNNAAPICVGSQLCDNPIGEMGWTEENCKGRTPGTPCPDHPDASYYCTAAGTCIKNGNCLSPTNCRADASCASTTPAPQCIAIKVYKDGAILSTADLAALQPGNTVTIALMPGGSATKAHFRVNGDSWNETTTKNGSGEFTWSWTIPSGITSFNIEGEFFDGTNWY